jgi:Uri superfamily endonuclease
MKITLPASPGSYVLVLPLPDPVFLTIGKLGKFQFDAGWYYYSGSAMGGLRGRIMSHLNRGQRLHWHIDYLSSSITGTAIEEVWWVEGFTRHECDWAKTLGSLRQTRHLVTGFGSSDCRCKSHLVYSQTALQSPIIPPSANQKLVKVCSR